MSEFAYENLPLVARFVSDFSLEVGPDGNKRQVELPGFIDFGTVVEGVFVPLERRKAPGLIADIERARASNQQAQPAGTGPQQTGTGVDQPPTQQTTGTQAGADQTQQATAAPDQTQAADQPQAQG